MTRTEPSIEYYRARLAAMEKLVVEYENTVIQQAEKLALSEQRAAHHESLLRAIFSSFQDGVVAADPKGRFIFHNRAACDILGQSVLEDPTRATYRLFNVDGSPIDKNDTPIGLALRGITTLNQEYILRTEAGDQKVLLVMAGPLVDDHGRIDGRGAISVFKDVTSIRARDIAIHQQQEWFRVTLASIGDGVIATDKAGRVMYLNEVAQALTGWTLPDATGHPLTEVFDIRHEETGQTVESPFQKAVSLGQVVGLANHTVLWSRDGRKYSVDDSGAPIRDAEGQTVGVVLIFRDVSERRLLEIELASERDALTGMHRELEHRVGVRTGELAEANLRLQAVDRLKSEFLATMSHELRTPLNSIIGFSSLLLEGCAGELNEEQASQLTMVHQSGQHLLRLISEILDLSRIESDRVKLEIAEYSLQSLLDEAVGSMQGLAQQRGVTLIADYRDEGVEIQTDRQRFTQILLNLLGNAIKFTPHGKVVVRCHALPHEVQIEVVDTGIGIHAEDLGKLFEPFSQLDSSTSREFEGTGLGLYLCKKLVAIFGGSIGVESHAGVGSRFYFALPRRPVESAVVRP